MFFNRRQFNVIPLVLSSLALVACTDSGPEHHYQKQQDVLALSKPIIERDGLLFRDLNANNQLDPYEDWRLLSHERASNLVSLMTLPEKIGTMMHSTLPVHDGVLGSSEVGYDYDALTAGDLASHITYYLSRLSGEPKFIAEQNNSLQALAEATRLGIPFSISTDPRHHFQDLVGSSSSAHGMSKWPETLGLASLRDPELTEYFAHTVAQDYRKVGFHIALGPQADLTTEPRWSRQAGAFSSDVELTQQQVAAVVKGLQGSHVGLTKEGVLSVVKHWVGYGAADQGFDGHNSYGRYVHVDNESLPQHMAAFKGAFDNHVGAVMPTYAVLNQIGQDINVGAGYSEYLLQELLRKQQGFDGLIVSDWYITLDCNEQCKQPNRKQREEDVSMAWGVEDIPRIERFVKGVQAGIDQFGGENDTDPLIKAVEQGLISEARINASVERALVSKFQQGLFENPYVDVANAIPDQHSIDTAYVTQAISQVLLQGQDNLPLPSGARVFAHDIAASAIQDAGFSVTSDINDADIVIIRATAPFEKLHPYQFFSDYQKEGRLDFRPGDPAYDTLLSAPENATVVFSVFMDRPPILSNIIDKADIVIGNFGVSDQALLETLLGQYPFDGKLPFELPSSMTAVEQQHSAIPDDSESPLFPFGYGLVIEASH